MIINLKKFAVSDDLQRCELVLDERLPPFIKSPSTLSCKFHVKMLQNYYVMPLELSADLKCICQRCLGEYDHHYQNKTELAICFDDETAEKLMELYECIVSVSGQVDLKELLTDELYLYGPEFHPEISDCDNEIKRFITEEQVEGV